MLLCLNLLNRVQQSTMMMMMMMMMMMTILYGLTCMNIIICRSRVDASQSHHLKEIPKG